jgi:hypothetical protein
MPDPKLEPRRGVWALWGAHFHPMGDEHTLLGIYAKEEDARDASNDPIFQQEYDQLSVDERRLIGA